MEKYHNIPEKNSLDSMEGVENTESTNAPNNINPPPIQNEVFREPVKLFISKDTLWGYKNATEEMLSAFQALVFVFRNRGDERLCELIDPDKAGAMYFMVGQICRIDIMGQQDLKDVSKLLQRIYYIVETIGEVQSREVREDEDSLRAINHALMSAANSTEDVRQRLSIMGTEEALQAARHAHRLYEELLHRITVIGRRIDRIGSNEYRF